MREYYIHDGQNEKSPFDIEQLKLESLKAETPIWYEGAFQLDDSRTT
jgi:cell wall assembly regulator SMI1